MNWRMDLFTRLGQVMVDRGLPASSVFAGGSLTGAPAVRPFIVYRLQDKQSAINDGFASVASRQFAEVWVYDEPGAYDTIDSILTDVVANLSGARTDPGAVCCEWQGNSPELADDELKAITRNATFRLIGATS